jgi:hypothetical protein
MHGPDYSSILNSILTEIRAAGAFTPLKVFQTTSSVVGGSVAALVGAWIGYRVSRSHGKRGFKRESHFHLLVSLNSYLWAINEIITCIINIKKLGYVALGKAFEPYDYNADGSYYEIASKTMELSKYVASGAGIQKIKDNDATGYIEPLTKMLDTVKGYDLFIKAGTTLKKDAVNYLLLVDDEIKTKYEIIRDEICHATEGNMKDFKINEHKARVIQFVFHLNEVIKRYS